MLKKAYLEITNGCNLSCQFCHGTTRIKRQMTETEFEVLTDRLAGEVKYLYFHLMGEPLLHPLLPQFVKRAWAKGFYPMLTTNGTLLATVGEALLQAPLYKISISLHAPAANVAFAEANYLSSCIAFVKKAAERNVISVFRLWNLGGEGEAENNEILDALRHAFPKTWQTIRSGYRLDEKKIFLEWGKEFTWPDLGAVEEDIEAPCFCHALRDQIGVLCDGTVVPCCLDADGILALGNLFFTPLEEILHSPRAAAIYNGFTHHRAVEEFCRKCDYAHRFTAT